MVDRYKCPKCGALFPGGFAMYQEFECHVCKTKLFFYDGQLIENEKYYPVGIAECIDEQLKKENAQLKADLANMQQENDELVKTNRRLVCINERNRKEDQQKDIEQLQQDKAELVAALRRLHAVYDFEELYGHNECSCFDDPTEVNDAFVYAYELLKKHSDKS
ncbi:MAG TPA: hypothetical protein VEF53_18665 [Patescibacteria group bacterium]|nr:hypothetical protein [Patescibacteria group bacterium]